MATQSSVDSHHPDDPIEVSRAARIEIVVLYAVPALTVLIVAALGLLIPAVPAVGARVYGGPAASDGLYHWRVALVRLSHGYTLQVPSQPVELHVRPADPSNARPVILRGVTDEHGAWEATFRIAGSKPSTALDVRVLSPGLPSPLASGHISVSPSEWSSGFVYFPPKVPGNHQGALRLSVWVVRGLLVCSFPGYVLVEATDTGSGAPVSNAQLSFRGSAIDVVPANVRTNQRGRALVQITPQFVSPELQVVARDDQERRGKWQGLLPAVAGAAWLDPHALPDGRLRVRTSAPYSRVYVDWVSRSSRLGNWVVPMNRTPEGSFVGVLPPLPRTDLPSSWLLLSVDEPQNATLDATTGWPVPAPTARPLDEIVARPAIRMRLPVLLDGLPAAVRRARHASRSHRALLLLVVAIGALVETGALWLYAVRARRSAEQWASRQVDLENVVTGLILDSTKQRWAFVVFSAIIAISFGVLAWISWLRID